MSKQAQKRRFSPPVGRVARRPNKSLLYLAATIVFVLVASAAYWLSKNSDAERVPEAPVATRPSAGVGAASEETTSADDYSPEPIETPAATARPAERMLTGAYRVLPARAYFYATPAAATSTGKYVLRGDLIYAEAESGGFIRTRFFNAAGDPVAGWLKKTEIRANSPQAPQAAPRRKTAAPAVADTPPKSVAAPTTAPASKAIAAGALAATGTVRVDTTYFYNSPDLTQRRRAFCIRGDKLRLSQAADRAVFATFVNWEKVTTTGWIKQEDVTIR